MKEAIAIDISCLEARPETGVERYARRLVEHLPKVAERIGIALLVRAGQPVPAIGPPLRVVAERTSLPRAVWRETTMVKLLRRLGTKVLHSPVAALPFHTPVLRVATIHDVPDFGAEGHEGRLSRHRLRLLHSLRAARRLIVPSVATRDAVSKLLPQAATKIRVIPHGVDPDFVPYGVPLQRERYGIPPGPFLLWVGTIRERKDPGVLLGAFARLLESVPVPDLHLVMCGDLRMDAEALRALLRPAGLENRLVLAGYVAREDLADLYREALMVVIPSKLEGFGLTALEAMACGKPLVVSSDAALTEVVGPAGMTFNTGDVQDLAKVLKHLLRDDSERERLAKAAVLRAEEYSWEGSARAHLEVYRELLLEAASNGA